MKNNLKILLITILLSSCAARTTFQAKQRGVNLKVNDEALMQLDIKTERKYSTTSFGNYKFKVFQEGGSTLYGLIPMKFNGGYLAADILFFAPATLFNLREVFAFYEFDLEEGVVRYKRKESDSWRTYKPTPEEIQRAKNYFNENK